MLTSNAIDLPELILLNRNHGVQETGITDRRVRRRNFVASLRSRCRRRRMGSRRGVGRYIQCCQDRRRAEFGLGSHRRHR